MNVATMRVGPPPPKRIKFCKCGAPVKSTRHKYCDPCLDKTLKKRWTEANSNRRSRALPRTVQLCDCGKPKAKAYEACVECRRRAALQRRIDERKANQFSVRQRVAKPSDNLILTSEDTSKLDAACPWLANAERQEESEESKARRRALLARYMAIAR